MMDTETWGEVIDEYTDAQAQDDGILIDIADLNVMFNGRVINRATSGATLAIGLRELPQDAAKETLELIVSLASFDGSGADAWGIVEADARFDDKKLWLVPNGNDGITLLLPDEY